jgi:UDP-hydrolysing UDP-N-acetyl-D-glucosamine 2-epimerase
MTLRTVAMGAHLLPPATISEVRDEFEVVAEIPMQRSENASRLNDAAALGRGISGFAEYLSKDEPDIVLVLGDRIEAFAAAAAAATAGIRVAHLHGGDRAEGIADESLRHAITKLVHIHLPATITSAQRIIAMGEDAKRVHIVGSPAIDGLADIPPLDDSQFQALGSPRAIVLLHPLGRADDVEHRIASDTFAAAKAAGLILILHSNHDPGRAGIMRAIESSECPHRAHLPRLTFIGLLQRVGVLIGNSSSGLIECSALGVRTVNIGNRQRGRERTRHVIDVPDPTEGDASALRTAIQSAMESPRPPADQTFGDGRTGPRTAEILATIDPEVHAVNKCNSY